MCHLIWNPCCLGVFAKELRTADQWLDGGPHFPLSASVKEIRSKPPSQLAAG